MTREVKMLNPRITGASQVPAICSSALAPIAIPSQRPRGLDDVAQGAVGIAGPLFTTRRPFEVAATAPAPTMGRLRRAAASTSVKVVVGLSFVAALLGGRASS